MSNPHISQYKSGRVFDGERKLSPSEVHRLRQWIVRNCEVGLEKSKVSGLVLSEEQFESVKSRIRDYLKQALTA